MSYVSYMSILRNHLNCFKYNIFVLNIIILIFFVNIQEWKTQIIKIIKLKENTQALGMID